MPSPSPRFPRARGRRIDTLALMGMCASYPRISVVRPKLSEPRLADPPTELARAIPPPQSTDLLVHRWSETLLDMLFAVDPGWMPGTRRDPEAGARMFITRVATRRWPGAELIEVPLPACMTDQKEVEVYLEEHCPGWFMARLAQIARLAMLDPPEHGFYA